MTNKRKYRIPSLQEKLRYLRALEGNDMNKSLTSRQLHISRSTLTKYYNLHWNEYIKQKLDVKDDMLGIESKKMLLSADLDNIRIVLVDSCKNAMELLNDKINNDPESLMVKDLVAYINTLLPYVAEKQAVAGVKGNSEENQKMSHPSFVQMINQRIQNIKLENSAKVSKT